ncbi:urease accessory protein UreF [Rhizobium oryziradicis]|uniref:Urease accessory protein UreF n=1 Tax=Rhizobium oryziradicis TaxID=1867956 RepID=A0A1Q8ZQ93_9HYPH|nr:urease accessory protein UreF [Rhizobium oryziradicis]OLP44245.1 urease accessory protein UreF [Rhizobium oryziradicis]
MADSLTTQGLLRLVTWLSPAFPVGGFAYSSGLEKAVEDGLVRDQPGLLAWLNSLLHHGAIWNDAVLLAEAWRSYDERLRLEAVAELALALAGSKERYLETVALGSAFREAAQAWPSPVLAWLSGAVAYPVAVGAISASHAISCEATLAAYLHAAVSQQVSAGIRLGLMGQSQGVALLAALENAIEQVAAKAALSTLDDLGAATVAAEIVSARHEMQASRLFRS